MEAIKKEVSELKLEVSTLSEIVKKITADNKKMTKQLKKLIKEAEPEDKPKRINGFAKPMKMSAELCKFLGVDRLTEMARTEVTKAITTYVKEHGLQNPNNKRELILDAKLKTIIQPDDDTTVTFFNLQKYMSKHYVKSDDIPTKEVVQTKVNKETPVLEPVTPAETDTKVKRVFKKRA